MYISKHINKKKKNSVDENASRDFSLGFLTGLFHERVPSINAFSFSS